MPKKNNVAIKRLDTFYLRAKISGYRARSAYKLIQLNQKYDFLGGAKVCLDLCAAPGSWMQVATKTMKPPCVVIGVDLNPIQAVPNAISILGDITTEKVRQELRTNLKTYKADVVLHDGAPNVGNNWHHDAYAQNVLVLHAFKLACEFLKSGGTFVTKVFRSKDHTSLEFVLKKLFKKVESTKPKSSRFESAEIFLVCQGFFCPQKIDFKFFDPKHVFSNLDTQPLNTIDLKNPAQKKRKAVGYEDGITMLFKRFKLSAFIDSPDYIEMLEMANQFVWDLPEPMEKKTQEIKELCKDIKVLGRKELRDLMNFRKNKREQMEKQLAIENGTSEEEIKKNQRELELKSLEASGPLQAAQKAHDNLAKIEQELSAEEATVREFEALQHAQKELDEIKLQLMKESKRKVRNLAKQRAKMLQRQQLKLMLPGDPGPRAEEMGLFTIGNFEDVQDVSDIVENSAMDIIEQRPRQKKLPKYEVFYKDDMELDSSGNYHRRANEEDSGTAKKRKAIDHTLDMDEEEDDADVSSGAMMESLGVRKIDEFKNAPAKKNNFIDQLLDGDYTEADEIFGERFYSKPSFENWDDDETMYSELDSALQQAQDKKSYLDKRKEGELNEAEEDEECGQSDSGESVDYDAFLHEAPEKEKLSDLGLALAAKMMKSKKGRRNVIEDNFNRRMWGDQDDIPDWFGEDEKKHNTVRVQVDPEDLTIHRKRVENVDVRTLKKVVEAKARKARRAKRKMDKANEKVKVITDQTELSEKEKSLEIKKIFSKIQPKKKKVRYVPMKKGAKGVKPGGAGKGPYKLVDRRMKKEKRAKQRVAKKKGGKKPSGKKSR